MSFANSLENTILDLLLGAGATLIGSTVSIALSTTNPGEDGSGISEPVGNGYARVNVTNNGTNFGAAAGGVKTNATDIIFPAASGGSWGTLTHWAAYDGGVMKLYGELDDGAGTPLPRTVNDTDVFRFLAGELRIALD